MTIWNLGSINVDQFFLVPHLPKAGETLAASEVQEGLGGKGANMSVASSRAGAHTCHIGAVGADHRWPKERLLEYGVDTRFIAETTGRTGAAVIAVDPNGENLILLNSGANRMLTEEMIGFALSTAQTGDILVMQNETSAQAFTARMGRELGLTVAYAAAPFDVDAVKEVLPFTDLLVLNRIEADQLQVALGKSIPELGVPDCVVTLGGDGCLWISGETETHFPATKVEPVDTTGAGDTFTGYLLAGLDRGMPMAQAISQAGLAAALMVTRHGTADVIPDLLEVQQARLG